MEAPNSDLTKGKTRDKKKKEGKKRKTNMFAVRKRGSSRWQQKKACLFAQRSPTWRQGNREKTQNHRVQRLWFLSGGEEKQRNPPVAKEARLW